MSLAAGTRLGPYEISSLIGAGGMGEATRPTTPAWIARLRSKCFPQTFPQAPCTRTATTLDTGRGDVAHVYPQFLPDGRSFLFTVRGPREPGIHVGSLGSTDTHRILADSSHAQFVEPGYIVFQRGRALMAVPFDPRRLEVSGAAFAIADQVFARQYFATVAGDLAYRFDGGISAQITWYARDGRRLKSVGTPGPYRQIALSPSGRRVAIQSGEVVSRGAEADIWMLDVATGVLSRVTTDTALDSDPAWSPDERRLAFTSNRTGRSSVFVKDLTSGTETPLFDFPETVVLERSSARL